MTHLRNVARGISPFGSWSPAGHSGSAWPVARPIGGQLLWLAIIGTAALVVCGLQRIESPPPIELRGDIVGVARIIDGDTIDIAGTRIRLAGIDAPESDQSCTDSGNRAWRCGKAATQAISARIAGRPLKCETSGLDRYRRVLATCALPDGSDINAWMVRQGWALAYYSEAYRAEEGEARAAARGVWAGSFMPPWEWRHTHRHWWMGQSTP
jgi:endonuclease YncB( thermonuclease family)